MAKQIVAKLGKGFTIVVVAESDNDAKLIVAKPSSEEGESPFVAGIGFDADFNSGRRPRVDVELFGSDIGNFNAINGGPF